MKQRPLLVSVLLLFIAVSTVVLVVKETRQRPPVGDSPSLKGITCQPDTTYRRPSPIATAKQSEHKVIVYYFHSTVRCPSCLRIESLTKEAIEEGFARAIRDGLLELRLVNIEEPGNQHFVDDFQLFTKSVVVVDKQDGIQTRWKNLDRVWRLFRDEDAFLTYVRDEVRTYLGEK
jgi:hypothetical protein